MVKTILQLRTTEDGAQGSVNVPIELKNDPNWQLATPKRRLKAAFDDIKTSNDLEGKRKCVRIHGKDASGVATLMSPAAILDGIKSLAAGNDAHEAFFSGCTSDTITLEVSFVDGASHSFQCLDTMDENGGSNGTGTGATSVGGVNRNKLTKEETEKLNEVVEKYCAQYNGRDGSIPYGCFGFDKPQNERLKNKVEKLFWTPGYFFAICSVVNFSTPRGGQPRVTEKRVKSAVRTRMSNLNSEMVKFAAEPGYIGSKSAAWDESVRRRVENWTHDYLVYYKAEGYPKEWEKLISGKLQGMRRKWKAMTLAEAKEIVSHLENLEGEEQEEEEMQEEEEQEEEEMDEEQLAEAMAAGQEDAEQQAEQYDWESGQLNAKEIALQQQQSKKDARKERGAAGGSQRAAAAVATAVGAASGSQRNRRTGSQR
ncbi:hypothetical protein Ndes2526B_g03949 [Nannochloris sp. 'desiccata']|nr:hypothetical protein KSW81_003790 [Chlorella desiccata (nom. nud.)]KAG7674259.1 hypothetical protein KSW81_006080 [Chlorella desiccata (nom. nud.)]KAG7675043.1 hypothetical protein KSW81_002549 [Chlorella desiccata (nom. nud.)]KAH7615857.1 hypothetical protein NADE_000696 [Chlorella desiccata (nom. nud.)]KAH7621107.1 hypothetical protein NADE_009157 [Chlorella desiccata (nom. nud.)]